MYPSPILAVTLAAHEAQLAIMAGSAWSSAEANPKPPSRIGMKSCFACAIVISCSIKFSVVRIVSGVSDHFENIVAVLLGVLQRNLLLDFLRDFLWFLDVFLSPSSIVAS